MLFQFQLRRALTLRRESLGVAGSFKGRRSIGISALPVLTADSINRRNT
jgi:hypothetical protein